MGRRLIARVALLLATLSVPLAAGAQHRHAAPDSPAAGQQNLLALGRQQFEDLRYEEAIQTLSAAILRPGNTPQAEIQIYELLALSYQAVHRNDEAEGAYRLVLARDPAHALSADIAPQVQTFFTGVQQRWIAAGRPGVGGGTGQQQNNTQNVTVVTAAASVTIEHHSPPEQQRNHAVTLNATLTDPEHRASRLVLAYRHGSSGLFRRIDATAATAGGYTAVIPPEVVQPPLVEYYFEAVSTVGVPVQARGDAFAPLRVAVPAPGGLPVWPFVAGGVALAAVVAVIVGVVISSQAAPSTLIINVTGH